MCRAQDNHSNDRWNQYQDYRGKSTTHGTWCWKQSPRATTHDFGQVTRGMMINHGMVGMIGRVPINGKAGQVASSIR
eukprot:2899260-Amphidinium_carterae.1